METTSDIIKTMQTNLVGQRVVINKDEDSPGYIAPVGIGGREGAIRAVNSDFDCVIQIGRELYVLSVEHFKIAARA